MVDRKEYHRVYNKRWYAEHREERLQQLYAWKAANPEKVRLMARQHAVRYKARRKELLAANPEKHRAQGRNWARKNRTKCQVWDIRRKGAVRNAIPLWADKELMRDMYEEAKYFGMTVDHIVPIRGKTVCGLHWEGDMQLLSRRDNIVKGNRLQE